MSTGKALLDRYGGPVDVSTTQHNATANATTTIVAAPGAGYAILVLGGTVCAHTAGTGQWYHTSATGGNELSALMTMAAGIHVTVPTMELPENTALVCQAVTANVRGAITYALVLV